jgi:hypothetical protein
MPRGKGALMIVVYGLLALGIVMLVVMMFPLSCPGSCSMRREGFADVDAGSIQLTCPKGTKSYINEKGRTNCCKGEVNGTQCGGRIFCSLSGDSEGVPLCSQRIRARRYKGSYPEEFTMYILRYVKSTPQQQFIGYITDTLDRILKDVQKNPPKENATDIIQSLEKFITDEKNYLKISFPQEVKMYEMTVDEQNQALAEEVLVCLDNLMPIAQMYPVLQDSIQSQMSTAMCAPK